MDTFMETLSQTLHYDSGHRFMLIQHVFHFFIRGQKRSAKTDICIRDEIDIFLLVQADRRLENPDGL